MELQHRFTVPASVDHTWATFMELGEVAGCFPGATVTSYDGHRFEGTCKVKLGPIALMYSGNGTFVERDDSGHRAVIQATGKDKRGNGTAGATVTITVGDAGAGATAVEVLTDLNVTGKPAQFGRGVMQDVSDKLLGQFVACLEQRFAESGDPVGGGSEAGGDAPGEGATATEPVPTPVPTPVAVATNGSTPEATVAAAGSEAAPAADNGPAVEAVAPVRNVDRPAFTPAPRPSAPANDGALDLGATVLPVLIRSYAPQLAAGLVGFVLGVLVARSRRR